MNFNPSPLTGRNRRERPRSLRPMISIHLPLRGETIMTAVSSLILISIHLPLRGETECNADTLRFFTISIHLPLRGETNQMTKSGKSFRISIHLPLRGETPSCATYFLILDFNPSPLTGRNINNNKST